MKHLILALSALSLLLPSIVRAQNPAAAGDSSRHYVLEDSVVIVAGRYSTKLSRESNAIAVIDGRSLPYVADHSLLEALQWEVPSAYVVETRVGGFGVGTEGTGMVSIRGLGGKPNTGVALMIDGHPDFMGIFGHPLPDVYGMDDVERVDVLLGPSSTMFGSAAMGGVVNVVSSGISGSGLQASLEGGSWNTWNGALSLRRSWEKHGVRLSLRHGSSDGHVPQSDFSSTHVQGAWEYAISKTWALSVRGRYAPSRFDDPTRVGDPAELGTYGDIKRGMAQVELENTFHSVTGSTQLYVNAGHHEFYDGFVSDDRSFGFSTYQQVNLHRDLSLAAGMDLLQYGGKANLDNIDHTLRTGGVYALAMYSPLSALHIRAGLRYQYHSLEIGGFSPNAGISYTPLSGLRIYANVQSGFRYPTLRELVLFPSSNMDLQEEKSLGYEGGIEYVASRASLRLSAYRTRVEDMIFAVPTQLPPPPVRFENATDETLQGVEALLRYRPMRALQLQCAWSMLDAGSLTAFNPGQMFKYQIRAEKGPMRVAIMGQYVQSLFAGNNESLPMPAYHVLDITGSWQLSFIEVFVKARNVLNRHYQVLPGYAAPGAYFLTGVRYAIDSI
ncbi:TonB-dependent receptor [bacterium]|nr:TonB-dependent receptor [bacterium]